MIKVLIIGYVWPEPNSSAAGSRMLQLIEFFLEQQWQVTFSSPAAESEHRFHFEEIGVKKQNIKVNSNCFDLFVKEHNPDIVLFDRFLMEEQFGWRVEKHCPDAIRIIETVDLHCLREVRQKFVKKKQSLSETELTKELKQSEIASREIASIYRCDLSLMISSYEMHILENHFNINPSLLLHLPFMVENIDSLEWNKLPTYEQRNDFITIGNFRHPPNWDTVLYLKETLWLPIRKKCPNAKLHIYGAYPPPKANQLHNPKQGFLISGWANDAKQVMQKARICLAPLRFGAGLKGKLLEAMQCGTPSVTTHVGAESMHDNLEWNGVVTDNPEDFINAAIILYNDKEKWLNAQKNSINIINSSFDKNSLSIVLLNTIHDIKNNLKEHRDNNFIGSMLRHHSMKSTQYMSQWIEAKNKLK